MWASIDAGVGAAEQPLVQALQRELARRGGAPTSARARRVPARARWRAAALLRRRRSRQVVQQVGHLDRDAGRVAALLLGARPGLRLVLVVRIALAIGSWWSSATRVTPAPLSLATSSKW